MFQSGSMSRLALFFLNAAFGAVAIEAALSAGVAAEGIGMCGASSLSTEWGSSAAEDDRSEIGATGAFDPTCGGSGGVSVRV